MIFLSPIDEQLYRLLPAIYRIRDVAQGEPLRALLAVLEQELRVVEVDIDALYDNWFIETCDDWVVPYIGDLLDVQELDTQDSQANGFQERRAYIANTVAYRRRKGTTPILEQLTQDVTGWRSRAVEFGRLLETTQNLVHIRDNSTTVNLRANNLLEEIGTPFERQAAYSAEIRPPRRGGRYNVPNIGLYIWRLQSYPLEKVRARFVCDSDSQQTGQYYTFSPLGQEQMPLFNQPQTKTDIVTLSEEINVPALLRRTVLADELTTRRLLRSRGEKLMGKRYFDTDPVLQIWIDGQPQPLPTEAILIEDLQVDNSAASSTSDETNAVRWKFASEILWDGDSQEPTSPPAHLVAVDPERGRLVFRPGFQPERMEVSYFYGFSDDLGGGPYGRIDTLPTEIDPNQLPISPWHWQIQQATSPHSNPLATAIDAWNRTAIVRDGLRRYSHIPLALIDISLNVEPPQVAKRNSTEPLPTFKPGIVKGFQVVRGLCPTELVVRPGIAIDREGRRLNLSFSWSFDVVKRFEKIIPELSNRVGVLVLFYKPKPKGNPVDLGLVAEIALEGYPKGTFIPLATLKFDDSNQLLGEPDLKIRPSFNQGIVQGLTVYTRPGTLEMLVTAGTGVDAKGHVLVLTDNYPVNLNLFQGSVRFLIIVPSASGDRRFRLVSETELEDLDVPYLQLALLSIPQVTLSQIKTKPEQVGRNAEIELTGLTVNPAGSVGGKLTVSAGTVKLPSDKTLTLAYSPELDLSAFVGRTILLFLSSQSNQGWLLSAAPPPEEKGDAYLGMIPVVPPADNNLDDPLDLASVDRGWIVISDSATYPGDLAIAVPPHTHLQILGADGCRPHLLGNLMVQGWSEEQLAQGELLLDGLLVEGALQVLPGSLGKLSLKHCTLVPQENKGLRVYSEANQDECTDTDEFSLLAFVVHSLMLMWKLIGQEVGLKTNAPAMSMGQFLLSTCKQLIQGMTEPCQPQLLFLGGRGNLLGRKSLQTIDNNLLEVSLYRTISGPLYLTDTVPHLQIQDSVIDKSSPLDSSAVAIAAPGTAIDIEATTVIGRTTARFLKASNCLFTEKVTVLRHQKGCLRFSYVPIASSTPRRYQCQPDLALRTILAQIPNGITAFSQVALLEGQTNNYGVFAGTDGEGIFNLWQTQVLNQGEGTWQNISGDLRDRTLTAIVAYRGSQPALEVLLVGTATGNVFQLTGTSFDELLARSASASPEEIQPLDWRQVPLPNLNAAITSFYPDSVDGSIHLWVTTNGNGIWRGTIDGQKWEEFNEGLTNLSLTAVIRDRQQQLWIGTADTGAFKLTNDRWVTVNRGLTNGQVTKLLLNAQGLLLAATWDGIFRFNPERQLWQDASIGLTSREITALAAHQILGTLSNQEQYDLVFAGSRDGKLFRSLDGGQTWQPLSLDLQGTDITALMVENTSGDIWLGAADGSVWRSQDRGQSWQSMRRGRPKLAQKLQIINQLQPNFTSVTYGDPGYAQLRQTCPEEIGSGAEDGAEMGVFNSLKQPQREANLLASLDEYLRFGLEAGIFYIT